MTTQELLDEGTKKFGKHFEEIAGFIADKLCDEFMTDAIDILLDLRCYNNY